ncbi:hypothetical protein [Desulfobacula toluolica]|uniref:Uncharacterized protein n=1 Tax=Desulfobacula toluolica (strain DSM 7467 / Tol2) TaxID=651182 RepID=K0NGW8_DESTT|nr:hypothetical protein [Desulfobacula toluolica]CCK78247.1 uncharacterized protein TOL2_C00770 [Desulfobacula toluolica Tol2]
MEKEKRQRTMFIILLTAVFVMLGALSVQAKLRTRIAVLPFYVEQGNDADTRDIDLGLHYRRMSGFIENQLVGHDFEVIDPFAKDASEKELNRIMEKTIEDSMLVAKDMCQKYAVDAVYIVWLKIKTRKTSDGYYKASAMLDGKGYDSGGRSLGANVLKTFKVTRRDFDEAVAIVEKEVGDVVGRTLTNWSGTAQSQFIKRASGGSGNGNGLLARNAQKQAKYLNIRLDQANEYELIEVFGKILNTVRGVMDTRRYNQRIVRDNPQACVTEWEVEINPNTTDPFRLQSNIMKMVNDILDAGGTIRINNVPYRYSPSEMKLMMGFFPGEATSRSIQFIINRERVRDREFKGRYDPERATQYSTHDQIFE